MTTAARKKKTSANPRSTDRGGAVLLPLGVALIAFGFMMLLGATIQSAAQSLIVFKNMAIGLGGGLYLLVPLFILWLGALACVAAKRHVSMYAFTVAFLLLLAVGALMTLTLNVNDREYGNLMDYVRNLNSIVRSAAVPDSMGEYLRAAYHRYYGRFAGAGFYPGGGALGMLLAYPLHTALGNVGAVVLLALAAVGLVFALFRQNPAALMQRLSDRKGQRAQRKPVAAPQAEAQPLPQQEEPVYPEDDVSFEPAQPQPAWPSRQYPTAAYPHQEPETEPGFIPQPAGGMMADAAALPETYAWREPPVPVRADAEQAGLKPVAPKPAQPQWQAVASRKTDDRPTSVDTPPTPSMQKPGSDATTFQTARRERVGTAPEQAPALEKPETRDAATPPETRTADAPPRGHTEPAAQAAQGRNGTSTRQVAEKPPEEKNETAKPAAAAQAPAAPAVPAPRREKPVPPATLDGMAKGPEPRQIRLAIDHYEIPPIRLLSEPPAAEHPDTTQEDMQRADKLIETLQSFSIPAHLHDIVHGPTVTRFAIRLAEGVNVSKLRSVMDNLTIELKAKGDIRAEIPIPGTSFVGLEVSNDRTSKVYLREVLTSPRMMESRSPTAVALGKDITGTPIVCELMDMPHLLIAGATGSGKSVCINSIICSILYRASPRNVKLIMVDPKFVELQPYNDVPHLMMPVITDAKKATAALDRVCQMMDERYQILMEAGVRNLDAYNRKLAPDEDPLPRIIVIVDEMADLMTVAGKQIEESIKRITAKARAAGICLILATQRPSVNIITGVIKANIPGRIAFRVSSPFDSKTILDNQGAEKLLGFGDMLYRSTTREPIRVQGCFVADKDVEQTVEYIRSRNKAEYDLDLIEYVEKADQPENGGGMGEGADAGEGEFDELLPQAIEMAVESGQMSISMLQRVLRVGYARSGRLIDEMTRRGIISGNEGTKPRKTLMTREQYMAYLEQGE